MKQKTVVVPSAIPVYAAAAVWILFGLILPIYRLWAILLTGALSVGAWFAARRVFRGREVTVDLPADSGDAEVDRQIAEGRAALKRIREANDAIPDPEMTACMDRMEKAGYAVFDALEKDSGKSAQVRRFMTYYLPTADKLLSRYRELAATGSTGENVTGAMGQIRSSMQMVANAFEKQLDALYKDSALDIETDIEVLDTMIRADHNISRGVSLGGGAKS